MSDVPPAIVESPRPPGRPRPERAAALRKLVGTILVVIGCIGAWKFLKWYTRSDRSKQLEARQDKARKAVGHGLDKLFDRQLDRESSSIDLLANFHVASGLGTGYDAVDCGKGFDDAFEEALGSDVVNVSTIGIDPDSATQLTITADITPTDQVFQLPNSETKYPGIALNGTMKFMGHEVPLKVEPASAIEFKYMQLGISFEGLSAADVAGGVLEGTCKQAGYELLEALTTWKRPPPPPRADPVTECNQGFHCRENAEELEAKDPATAAKLYASACEHDDEAACLRGAAIEMELTKGVDDHRAQAEVMLEMACARDLARTCTAAAQVKITPLEAGHPIAEDQRAEALAYDLHGCDLGDSEGCEAAVPLVKGTPFADAAPLLGGAPTAKSRTLGTIIALRWGQWTQLDQGQATAWVTREPAHLPEGAMVTPFSGDRIPTSIHPPDGVGTVYAIALRGYGEHCTQCMPSGGGDSIYSMRAMSCVCAIAPKG